MAKARPVRWLHLSDLHLGCRGMEIWHQIETELWPSVQAMAAKLGPPDLLLLSGDLTFRGAAKEFALVDRFLAALLGWLEEAAGGPEPLLLAVPGNHDLARPQGDKAFPYRILESYDAGDDDPDVGTLNWKLWEKEDARFLDKLFPAYLKWFDAEVAPGLARTSAFHPSHFPGDFSARIEIPETFPLVVVGLNSTWRQYRGDRTTDEFLGKLSLPLRQFHAALPREPGGSPLVLFADAPRALLMIHQPPAWLSPPSRRTFEGEIYPPGRFDLCHFGHLHQARSRSESISGGLPRVYFQAPSLFGLESYGTASEARTMGYAWGSLSAEGEVRIWPLRRVVRGDGSGAFVHDPDFPEDAKGALLSPARRRPTPPRRTARPERPEVDWRPYLADLIDQTERLEIAGISPAGESREALIYPIERLYTPLASRAPLADRRELAEPRSVRLSDLLPRHQRLLLEGQPGAGKTTFLRLTACLLGRDILGIPCPGGPSWRQHHLGLGAEPPPVPILVRAAELEPRLAAAPPLRHGERFLFLDHLEVLSKDNGFGLPRATWEALLTGKLAGREALLLVDGLDEVVDERSRRRIFAAFRDAVKAWPCRIVVTSRPLEKEALTAMGFHPSAVEPFGEEEFHTFLDRWVTALYGVTAAGELKARGERYRKALVDAICKRPGIKRLATNPVMLTSLCVIHWNDQQLPDGRTRVYRAVIHWLLRARADKRRAFVAERLPHEKPGSLESFAERAFACLGLAMMQTERGKRSLFDLEEAAVAVEPVVERDFHSLRTPEARRDFARDWLGFECLGSGVVEELPHRRLRFWHLTFQELLAALQLAREESDWWGIVAKHLDEAAWRETVDLLPGCLLDVGGPGRVDLLLERTLETAGDAPDLAAEARVAGIVGRLLQTLSAYGYRPRPEVAASYQKALDRSLAIFTPEGAAQVPIKDRIAAAEALGRGGDPRLAPEKDNFLEVPGLGGLRLGKYPVTVEEYQRFVENRGYEERSYWKEGWEVKEEQEWEAPDGWVEQLETPNRPVVGVSWYEAAAYCRWLGELQRQDVRLPMQEEWEKAATPARGEYPWGVEEPDAERANFAQNVHAPTPVGLYPLGDGPFRHCDLAGNVWEWCSDETGDPEDFRSANGGAFWESAEYLRAACHNWSRAPSRFGDRGFRCAAAPASRLAP